MMSNKLLVEIMRRVKACNKHDKLVGDIGLESIDPALCSMSDMFTYSISDIDKGDTVVIHDELSQRTCICTALIPPVFRTTRRR